MTYAHQHAGTVTLMGSGELTSGMATIHRHLMHRSGAEIRPVFIDTPAGFELNAPAISQKAIAYFREHFGLTLQVASFRHAASADALAVAAATETLRRGNYLFSGPGSPTYAVRNWRGSPIFHMMATQLGMGNQLVLSSAAALAVGRQTLPVYEIYKAGADPFWVEGLDLLGPYGYNVAIVPHWNNASGGTHDTTHCYLGAARFATLQAMLPPGTTLLGIDEYTACRLDLARGEAQVMGAGGVVIRRAGVEFRFEHGERFTLEHLRSAEPMVPPPPPPASPVEGDGAARAAFHEALELHHSPTMALAIVQGLMSAALTGHPIADIGVPEAEQLPATVHRMLATLALWLDAHPPAPHSGDTAKPPAIIGEASMLHALIRVRHLLREARQWALADQLRDHLATLGVILEDGPGGTQWRMARDGLYGVPWLL